MNNKSNQNYIVYYPKHNNLTKGDIYTFLLMIGILFVLLVNSALASLDKNTNLQYTMERGPHLNNKQMIIVDYEIHNSKDNNYLYDVDILFYHTNDCEAFVSKLNKTKSTFRLYKDGPIYDSSAYLDFFNTRMCKVKCRKLKMNNNILEDEHLHDVQLPD